VRLLIPVALLSASACVIAPATATVTPRPWTLAADSAAALAVFRENIDAIHKRDRERYLATYVQTPRLVRNGPNGPEFGFDDWSARRSTTWPDTLIAADLRVVPIAPGTVYGTYRYIAQYGDSATTGVSERVFVRTPSGWRIAVTTAFGSDLRYSPRREE
jgi:hypothetical protein